MLHLEWYGTLFPRIPVLVQKDLEAKLSSKGLSEDHKHSSLWLKCPYCNTALHIFHVLPMISAFTMKILLLI